MAGKRLGLFKPHHSLFSSACIAPHRNIYFAPYQMKKKKSYRERGIEGGIDSAYRESTKVCLKIPKGNIKSFSVKVCYFYLYLSLALFHHTYCLEGYHYARRRAGVKTICITTLTVWLQALCHDTLFQTIQPTIITLPPLCCTSLTHTHRQTHACIQPYREHLLQHWHRGTGGTSLWWVEGGVQGGGKVGPLHVIVLVSSQYHLKANRQSPKLRRQGGKDPVAIGTLIGTPFSMR